MAHLLPQPHLDPLLGHQLPQSLDDRGRAAHGEVDAPLALEVVDQRVDAGRVERVAADQ